MTPFGTAFPDDYTDVRYVTSRGEETRYRHPNFPLQLDEVACFSLSITNGRLKAAMCGIEPSGKCPTLNFCSDRNDQSKISLAQEQSDKGLSKGQIAARRGNATKYDSKTYGVCWYGLPIFPIALKIRNKNSGSRDEPEITKCLSEAICEGGKRLETAFCEQDEATHLCPDLGKCIDSTGDSVVVAKEEPMATTSPQIADPKGGESQK